MKKTIKVWIIHEKYDNDCSVHLRGTKEEAYELAFKIIEEDILLDMEWYKDNIDLYGKMLNAIDTKDYFTVVTEYNESKENYSVIVEEHFVDVEID